MRFLLCVLATLLICGCDYFDDSEDTLHDDSKDTLHLVMDSTPVILPTDADWELIATLERNPLRPETFYIFEWQAEAIMNAYLDGKHFIFEIGKEHREMYTNKIRHYIIQPTLPFQDEDKHPGQRSQWEEKGVKFETHQYFFLSEGWYIPKENIIGEHAVGMGVEFHATSTKPIEADDEPAWTSQSVQIGLINTLKNPIIGRGPSYIEADARLRIYVSQEIEVE